MEFFAAHQWEKKVMSVIPGLVDFAIGLMNSVLNLPDRQGIGSVSYTHLTLPTKRIV